MPKTYKAGDIVKVQFTEGVLDCEVFAHSKPPFKVLIKLPNGDLVKRRRKYIKEVCDEMDRISVTDNSGI